MFSDRIHVLSFACFDSLFLLPARKSVSAAVDSMEAVV